MQEIKAVIRTERLQDVVYALHELPDMPGLMVSTVRGFGRRSPAALGDPVVYDEIPFTKLETVVDERVVAQVIDIIVRYAQTGRAGDGKIFVVPITATVRIRDGARLGGEA